MKYNDDIGEVVPFVLNWIKSREKGKPIARQCEMAVIKKVKRTGYGFYCDLEVPETASDEVSSAYTGVFGKSSKSGDVLSFILHANNGRIECMEGYSMITGEWPSHVIGVFELTADKSL